MTDSCRDYKSRLEKEETTRRQQVKILQKAHEDQIKEKEQVIVNLRDEIEENEGRMRELQELCQGRLTIHPRDISVTCNVKGLTQDDEYVG